MKKTRRKPWRKERRDLAAVCTEALVVELGKDQYFCETEAAYEIWDEAGLPRRIKRIPKLQVILVYEK